MRALDVPGRVWIPTADGFGESSLDQLCRVLRRRKIVYGYLSMRAPLIGNLSTLENLWLPHAWLAGWTRQRVHTRLEELRRSIPPDLEPDSIRRDPEGWLVRRPVQLSAAELEWSVLVRAALARPAVVVIDPAWTVWQGPMMILAEASWWLPAAEAPLLNQAEDWATMSLDQVCGWVE